MDCVPPIFNRSFLQVEQSELFSLETYYAMKFSIKCLSLTLFFFATLTENLRVGNL